MQMNADMMALETLTPLNMEDRLNRKFEYVNGILEQAILEYELLFLEYQEHRSALLQNRREYAVFEDSLQAYRQIMANLFPNFKLK